MPFYTLANQVPKRSLPDSHGLVLKLSRVQTLANGFPEGDDYQFPPQCAERKTFVTFSRKYKSQRYVGEAKYLAENR